MTSARSPTLVIGANAEYFMANGRKYELLSYSKPPPPYIVFDLYNKEHNNLRGCFVIKKNKQILKLVRAANEGERPRVRNQTQ